MEIQTKPDQSFPLTCRLAHSYEFDAVFTKNEARLSSTSLLLVAKRNSLGFNRLGMIVSKKSVAKSVQRSKVKRKIRETFRKNVPALRTGWDIVVMTRPKIKFKQNLDEYLLDSFTALAAKIR